MTRAGGDLVIGLKHFVFGANDRVEPICQRFRNIFGKVSRIRSAAVADLFRQRQFFFINQAFFFQFVPVRRSFHSFIIGAHFFRSLPTPSIPTLGDNAHTTVNDEHAGTQRREVLVTGLESNAQLLLSR